MSEGNGIMETMNEEQKYIIKQLAEFSSSAVENPNCKEILEYEDIGLPLAFAVQFGLAIVTEKGWGRVQATYDHLLSVATERYLEEVEDLVYTDKPIPLRKQTITFPE